MWNELISMENLLLAYKKASKNRRSRQEIANFEFELEKKLFQIRDKLADGSYHHNSPSLGGDAETSEVSRHGTHKLFSKASLFRFAWRPRHAFCPHFTQSRRGRRDKRGFPHGTNNLLRKISTIYSARRPYFASHGVLAMRFIKKRGFPAWQANFVKQGF